MNKYVEIKNWLERNSFGDIRINASSDVAEISPITIKTVANDNTLRNFVDGTKEKRLEFVVGFTLEYSEEFDDVNDIALERVEQFKTDLLSCTNLPNFGNDAIINNVETAETPSISVDFDGKIAYYQLSCFIEYMQ